MGDCQIEELNKRKIRVLGLNHTDVKWFIKLEDKEVKAYNNYAKRVNEMGAGLRYRKNRYVSKPLWHLFSHIIPKWLRIETSYFT